VAAKSLAPRDGSLASRAGGVGRAFVRGDGTSKSDDELLGRLRSVVGALRERRQEHVHERRGDPVLGLRAAVGINEVSGIDWRFGGVFAGHLLNRRSSER